MLRDLEDEAVLGTLNLEGVQDGGKLLRVELLIGKEEGHASVVCDSTRQCGQKTYRNIDDGTNDSLDLTHLLRLGGILAFWGTKGVRSRS